MIRLPALLMLAALAACSDPALTAGVTFGPGGVSVRPALSGNVGGVDVVAVAPPIR
jgi:hypothetical protein